MQHVFDENDALEIRSGFLIVAHFRKQISETASFQRCFSLSICQ